MPRVTPVPADSPPDGARQRGDGQPKAGPGAASVKPGWPAAGAHLGDAGHKPEDGGLRTVDAPLLRARNPVPVHNSRERDKAREREEGGSATSPGIVSAKPGWTNRVPKGQEWPQIEAGRTDGTATSLKDDVTDPANAGTAQRSCTAFERECVQFFTDIVQVLGVPKSVGQIYGLLFASPQPLGFTDIVEKLAISKGSASQGLQLLKSLGAVQGVEAGGVAGASSTRRELFVPELGLRRLVGGVLREKIEPLVGEGADRIHRLEAAAKASADAPTRKFSGNRVKQIQTWRRQMGLLLPILKTLLSARGS